MGLAECNSMAESKRGSVPSGHGCSPGARGQTVKNHTFYPHSVSISQSIINDHMVSHYKKIYTAKATIDTSVPKSLIHSVKYNDRIRQERMRKGDRSQSARPLSQSFSRASCSPAQSRLSLQDDRSPFLCSRSSFLSSARFRTSFPVHQVVYPSAGSQRRRQPARSASELSYRSPEATSHQQQSACSSAVLGNQSLCKSFQDPVQKTYSGDLIQRHSQHFTSNKPFTPKTLKSDKSSYLSEYRYYRTPRKKRVQDGNNSTLMQQETYHGSTKTMECTSEDFDDPSQGFSTEHERSEGNSPYFSASRQSQRSKSGDQDFFDSSSRASPGIMKSPLMKTISAEEVELMYLEFISAVTDDILSRGYFSDRALDRLLKQYIDMNHRHLDEDKMRHLLETLRKDYQDPSSTSSFSTELKTMGKDLQNKRQPKVQSGRKKQRKTKEDNDLFPYASLIKHDDAQLNAVPVSSSTPCGSPDRTSSPTNGEEDCENDTQERGMASSWLSEHPTDYTEITEEGNHQNQTDTNIEDINGSHDFSSVSSEGSHQDQAEVLDDGQSSELEDLGKMLSDSLQVSSNTNGNMEAAEEQLTNTLGTGSDDEF
ncbi:spermatogenesis-associated protein 7 homolog [Genypterus blacodes]|uniref:spermatogenesis-associated protein 7 homolog n=1 Tax=Genypterus blacodes TaxID=154954 RepID=UPI003F765B0C